MRLMKFIVCLIVALSLSVPAIALMDQDQGQLQGQAQGQIQAQQAVSGNSGNDQSVNYEDERFVNPTALGFDTPEGNDGLVAQTPWGSGAITQQSELTQLGIVTDIYLKAGKPVPEEVCTQALEAARPCRFLGVGPKRFNPVGFLCWKGLRK